MLLGPSIKAIGANIRETMLIVDDSYASRLLFKSAFLYRYKVLQADDCAEALSILRNRRVDMMLIKLSALEKNAFAMLNEMKKSLALSTIPVIAVTGVRLIKDRLSDGNAAELQEYAAEILRDAAESAGEADCRDAAEVFIALPTDSAGSLTDSMEHRSAGVHGFNLLFRVLGCCRDAFDRIKSDITYRFYAESAYPRGESRCKGCALSLYISKRSGAAADYDAAEASSAPIRADRMEGRSVFMASNLLPKENKRTEKILRSQLQALTDAVPGGLLFYVYDIESQKLEMKYFNDEVCRLSGCSREGCTEILKNRPLAGVLAEDEPIVKSMVYGLTAGGKSTAECEYRIRTKTGIKWVQLTGRVEARKKKTVAIYVILIDITERKQVEELLAYRNMCLDVVDEALSAGTVISGLGIGGELLYVSTNIERLLGYTADEFKTIHADRFRKILHPDDLERVAQLNDKYAVERPEQYTIEYRLIRKDKSMIWVMEKATLVPDFLGQPVYISVYVDITSQISAMNENQRMMQILAKQSGKFVIWYDFISDSFRPYDSTVNKTANVLPIYSTLREYIDRGIVAAESQADAIACYESIRLGVPENSTRFKAKGIDGEWRWMRINASTVFSDTNKPLYAIATFDDVTDSYEKEVAFKRYEEMVRTIGSDRILYLDYDMSQNKLEGGSELLKTPAFETAAGLGFQECIKEIAGQFVFAQDRAGFRDFFRQERLVSAFGVGTSSDAIDFRIKLPNMDRPKYVRASYQMITDPYSATMRILLSCQLIDAEKRAELELINRAQIDEVTGVFNRSTFISKVNERLNSEKADQLYAFAMLDVDHFKGINDAFGHVRGDRILKEFAKTIRSVIHEEDLVGRLGGDEFGLFFGAFPAMEELEEKLHIIMNGVFRDLGDNIRVSASIGIALFPQDGDSFEKLYMKADTALYQAKENGRNCYVYYAELNNGLH